MKFYRYGKEKDLKLQFTINTKLKDVPEVAKPNLSHFAVAKPTKNEIGRICVKPIDENIANYAEFKSGVAFKKHEDGFVIRLSDEDFVFQLS